PSGSVHAAPLSGGVHSTSSGPAAIPPVPVDLPDAPSAVLPPIATHANSLDDFFNEGSENKVGDGLASLPKERTRPTSAVGALAARTQTPNPPQVAVAPVASMQTPATPVYAHGSSTAGSLIGDRCDPSRHGQSATPVILWVALVLLTLGGLTAWLVVNGLNRRTASIQASQAFLRLTDLAAAEGEYFNAPRTTVAGPTALASAPATAVSEKSGNEYAATMAALEEKKLLTPALWKDGVTLLDTPEKPAVGSKTDPKPAGMRLAEANGYRYVLWHTRLSTAQPAINFYSKDPAHLDRGFAVAAIPTDSANWAYAIDDRGRLIQWRYTPPAAGQKSAAIPPGGPSDPVETACYPSDSDFDKIPIR
ncbi:MAG TPA: hypothetical protein VL860_15065, partial [Planctomycetota bacterium]|nr:hypothetical protein [Planctomycetota bacterium]